MSLSRCSSWPTLSLNYIEINNIMYAVKTRYKNLYIITIVLIISTSSFELLDFLFDKIVYDLQLGLRLGSELRLILYKVCKRVGNLC